MSSIDKISIGYYFSKLYINFCFKRFYNKYVVVGKKNIPLDEPVIFAPNHLNSAMDALAVLSVMPYNKSVVFVAKADIFGNKFVNRILSFVKILPAFRITDGIKNLHKNNDTFEQCVEVLMRNHAICIMPEGNQGEKKHIRPLMKGIFRIAFTAQQQNTKNRSVKIIPVGLDYGHLQKARKHVIIQFGKPIDTKNYMEMYAIDPVKTINQVKNQLKSSLVDLTVHVNDTDECELYEKVFQISENNIAQNYFRNERIVLSKFKARQFITKKLNDWQIGKNLKFIELKEHISNLESAICELKISLKILNAHEPKTLFEIILITALLTITLPIFIVGFDLNFLPFFMPVWLRKSINPEYDGFFSSIHFGFGVFTFPIFYLIQSLIIIIVFSTPFYFLPFLFIASYQLGKLSYLWYKNFRLLINNFQNWRIHKIKHESMKKVKEIQCKINQMLISD
jgi:1-acyl-sn-glycerol-3-phosphate acyltransferase